MCNKENEKSEVKGFTLIELLVVLAIIGILAAILFPVFARARENARRASCMSNMKQMALGVMQYTQDYDDYYPLAWYGVVGTSTSGYAQTNPSLPGYQFATYGPSTTLTSLGNWITWMDMIYPYVRSVQLFECPSFDETSYTSSHGLQYQMNGAYDNAAMKSYDPSLAGGFATDQYASDAPIHNTSTPLSAILRPSETIMLFEARGSYCAYGLEGLASFLPPPTNSQASLEPHLGGMNLAYGDGHVKWMSSSALLAQTGTGSTSACNLASAIAGSPTYITRPLCSKLWNPFIP